jgi:aminodeoxyfutalosine synthase
LKAAELGERFPAIDTINPLPMLLDTVRRTTGYEDVKMVALSRLAAPGIRHVQVDWQRYGPKLAQVALTFGADDLDNVSPSDDAPDGRRRSVLEEVRRNIEAAGFTPVQRDGNFQVR